MREDGSVFVVLHHQYEQSVFSYDGFSLRDVVVVGVYRSKGDAEAHAADLKADASLSLPDGYAVAEVYEGYLR